MGGSEDETVGAVRWRETGDDGRWWEEGDGDVRQEMGDGSWGSRWWWLDGHVGKSWASEEHEVSHADPSRLAMGGPSIK
jgi:hypothetical protein